MICEDNVMQDVKITNTLIRYANCPALANSYMHTHVLRFTLPNTAGYPSLHKLVTKMMPWPASQLTRRLHN